jgi:hypothetical protein
VHATFSLWTRPPAGTHGTHGADLRRDTLAALTPERALLCSHGVPYAFNARGALTHDEPFERTIHLAPAPARPATSPALAGGDANAEAGGRARGVGWAVTPVVTVRLLFVPTAAPHFSPMPPGAIGA